MVKHMKCYLCSSCENKLIHKGVRGASDIDVYRCEKCGLVFLSKFIEDIDEFYESSQMLAKDWSLDKIRKTTWRDDERRYNDFRGTIENRNIMDFGCGAGGFLSRARNTASDISGIELDTAIRNKLIEEGINMYASLDDCEERWGEWGGIPWDVITMFHVLEHLPDPVNILSRLKKLVAPNGKIIIEVPNADDALLSLYRCEDFADFTYWKCHLFLYTFSTLREVIEKAGLKVNFMRQIQRYPLANHLMWLSKGCPGGHTKWEMLCGGELDNRYGDKLAMLGIADTIIAEVS